MAFNEDIAQRIRQILYDKGVAFSEKKMFSGLCFMVDDKMCCGTRIDKRTDESLLLCRIGEKAYETAIERDDCIPMDSTGRTIRGYLFVIESGFKSNKNLMYWLQLYLDFNPFAQKSKKK